MSSHVTLYERINAASLDFLGRLVEWFPILRVTPRSSIILCYHSVGDTGWRFSTNSQDFAAQIQYLQQQSKVISLDQLLAGESGVVITFDDGYQDNYVNAFPILQQHGLTATVFMIGDPEKADRATMQSDLPLLTVSELKKLHHARWSIGYHTATHANLSLLSDSQLRDEVITGKKEFESKTGLSVTHFAYPYGLYTDRVLELLEEAGFSAAFTINGGQAKTHARYLIPRVAVEGNMSLRQFAGLVSPLGSQLYRFFISVLRLKVAVLQKLNREGEK